MAAVLQLALGAGLLLALPTAFSVAATDEYKTEDGLRAALAPFESRYEAACLEVQRAGARLKAEPGSADAGQAWSAARRRLFDVISDPAMEPILEHWASRRTVTRDPSLTRRVRLWSQARLVGSVELGPEVRALAESLSQRLREAAPDRARDSLAGTLSPDMRRLIRLRDDVSRRRGQNYYHDMVFTANDVRPYWLAGVYESVARRSAPAWESVVANLKETAGGKELRAAGLDAAMARRAEAKGLTALERKHLPAADPGGTAMKIIVALGFTPEELQSAPADPAGSVEQALRAWSRLFLERRADTMPPILKGHPWIPGQRNGPYAEGVAAFFAGLARDPACLTGLLGMSPEEAQRWAAEQKDRQLLALRRTLAEAQSEFAFYINPDADLNERFGYLRQSALRLPIEPYDRKLWGADARLVEEPLLPSYAFMGLAIGAELQRRFEERFGAERFTSRKAAAWLNEEVLAGGELLPLDNRLAKAAQGGYDFDRYLATLGIGKNP